MRGKNAPRNKEEAAAQGSAAAEMGNNSAKGKITWNTFYCIKPQNKMSLTEFFSDIEQTSKRSFEDKTADKTCNES